MNPATETDEKLLRQNLSLLELNFSALDAETRRAYKKFSPPQFEEVGEYKNSNNATHPLVEEMLAGDAAARLYAAILLSASDAEKSQSILEKLAGDSEIIKVQNLIGHGFSEIPVKYAAKSFLETGDIRAGFIEKAELLGKWKIAVALEAKEKNESFAMETLPTTEEVFEAANDAEKKNDLRQKMLDLADDRIVSARFIAAFVLQEIDETEAQKILENLTTEETSIPVLAGDIVNRIPANRIASAIIENRQIAPDVRQTDSPELIGRIFGSLRNLLFGKNK